MHNIGKGKGALREKVLHIVPESVNDVYDFDQQDASRISSASLQPAGLTAEFRSPGHIKHDVRVLRKCVKNKMLYSANAMIEASHVGKTSTPCAVTGHPKTKKKTPGTPAPWVELSRLQPDSLAAYAVSPIAVEHNSPNDLSRLNVNSMFDDMSSVLDDSAVFIRSQSNDVGTGSDWNNKISVASFDKVPSGTQCVIEDVSGESAGEKYSSDKHKSETDSGYPRFDSQCEFISLSAGDNAGTAKDRNKIRVDDHQEVNLAVSQDTTDSGDCGSIICVKKQALVEKLRASENSNENTSADSDCEVVLYKRGTLDPKKFNSSAARSSCQFTAQLSRVCDDVEPSDKSDDSGTDVASDKNLISGKLTQSVEGATSVCHKQSRVLRTRNNAVDSKSTSVSSAHCAPSIKVPRKADRKTELAELRNDEYLHNKLGNPADVENAADVCAKPQSRRKVTKKQNTESGSKKRKDSVQPARITEEACAGGAVAENGDAVITDGKCIIQSLLISCCATT